MFDVFSLGLFGVVAGLSYLYFSKRDPDIPAWSTRQQSLVSKTREKGSSAIYRSTKTPFGTPLISSVEKDIKTAYAMSQKAVKTYPSYPCLGERINDGPFVFQTYKEIGERINAFGSGMLGLCGLQSGKENMVGIFFKNSPAWLVIDHAACVFGCVSVPMYDTFDEPALQHIINHTSITTICVSLQNVEKLFSISGSAKVLKHLIIVDVKTISDEIATRAKALKITVHTMANVEKHGKENPKEQKVASREDLFTICYTSGTTGVPKGVMITHGNLAAGIGAFFARLPADAQLTSDDRHLSYLPLSHMFERIVISAMFSRGCKIGFFRGDILKLFDDINELRPTIFPSVPRLLSRLYDKIKAGVESSSPVKKMIFNFSYSRKLALLNTGVVCKDTIWDALVFKKIQAKLGGCIRMIITGAAPIDPEIITFLRAAVGCNVLEGYGQTETCATGTLTLYGDYTFPFGTHVGVPFPSCEVKLVDVPAMNYFADDKPNPRGEICFRGATVMKGYYKETEKTAEVIDKDGWLHTGDVGEVLANGSLKIIDRVKNIFKLSQGEYIAPEKIEIKIKSPLILQSFVYGDSLKSNLVAIIIPDPEAITPWAKQQGIKFDSIKSLCKNKDFVKKMADHVKENAQKAKLHKFEIPKAVFCDDDAFSVENGLMTPTFKTKRNVVRDKYTKEIDEMYKNLD